MTAILLCFTIGTFMTFDYALTRPGVPFLGLVLLFILAILLAASTVVAYLDARGGSKLF